MAACMACRSLLAGVSKKERGGGEILVPLKRKSETNGIITD